MIFDTKQMAELREKYHQVPDYSVHRILFLDRSSKLSGERKYLEELFSYAPDSKHKDWMGRLVNEDDNQHWGVWFEIMLFGWLRQAGAVAVEPAIHGSAPDFLFETSGHKVYIEARAMLISS